MAEEEYEGSTSSIPSEPMGTEVTPDLDAQPSAEVGFSGTAESNEYREVEYEGSLSEKVNKDMAYTKGNIDLTEV